MNFFDVQAQGQIGLFGIWGAKMWEMKMKPFVCQQLFFPLQKKEKQPQVNETALMVSAYKS